MEEISSLGSMATDGAESTACPESEPPKLDEERTQASEKKQKEQTTAADKSRSDDGGDVTKDGGVRGDGGGATNEDEDFEQISDGTFEVDESSGPVSADPPGSAAPEHSPETAKETSAKDESGDGGPQVSRGFEEVDVNVSAGGSSAALEESDMLGESDMTLPQQQSSDNAVQGSKVGENKRIGAMEVDNDDHQPQDDAEAGGSVVDAEMASFSDSPAVADKDAEGEERESNKSGGNMEATQQDLSMEALDMDGETNSGKDVVDTATGGKSTKGGSSDVAADENIAGDDDELAADRGRESIDGDIAETLEALEDEEADHDDEPVENVQEPEESDVCLIPDDTETQMTEEEKEQAILARENAEKEDAEAEAETQQERQSAAAEGTDAAQTEDKSTEANEESANENTAPSDAADTPEADEPLLEEMQASSSETGTVSKTIIAWIIPAAKQCKQCSESKLCGFRYKNSDSGEFEYLCDAACCDALMTAFPGKFFIRRKKFLIEELPLNKGGKRPGGEKDAAAEASKDDAEERSSSNSYLCLQCKKNKSCKYFFKQDDEPYYVCSDDCFNLLSAEEPEKFKLKRHSIRVRNIGSASISSDGSTPKKAASTGGAESRVVTRTAAEAEAARLERAASFTRRCAECFSEITLGDKNLLWETMDFCNEICLGKYQRTIGANCQTCQGEVPHPALGKYCVRFGFDVRQFCCAACLNEFKKGLKTCSCCQKDISAGNEGFLAPVGDKEQFKDFCSQACMRRYDNMCNPKKKQRNDICAVCNNEKPVRVEIIIDGKEHNFCSNPCFSAFKFVSNIVADQCNMCCKYFERKGNESFTIYADRRAKVFCSRICLNVFIIVNRRIVSCQWCKVKKYNFDMICRQQNGQEILMCSLNCLTLYGVSINAFSRTIAKCDNCGTSATPQYHLTMSDASMRNFCTYQCVMQFQSQFARAPLTLDSESTTASAAPQQQQKTGNGKGSNAPFPTGLPKRVKLKVSQQQQQQQQQQSMSMKMAAKNTAATKKGPTVPVISTVSSLASGETETMIGSVTVRRNRIRGRKIDSPPPPPPPPAALANNGSGNQPLPRGRPRKNVVVERSPSPSSVSPSGGNNNKRGSVGSAGMGDKASTQTETKIIAVPPLPPTVRNVQTNCRPQTASVALQTGPKTASAETQTEKDYSNKVLIPVPVPIYVPQPMYMYSAPFPVPVPIPLPIPVPIFIPTTRNSAQGILKEIKKIQDKMPADPFEAELLMMAEMVAEEKRDSDSDSEDEVKPDPAVVSLQYGNSVQQVDVANNSYGEDVLQMALKMATGEYDQPSVDLESAMTANTITNPPPGMVQHDDSMGHMAAHQMQQQQQQQQQQMMETQRGGRGRKRGAIAAPVSPRNSRSPVKRQRLQELESAAQPTPQAQAMQPAEKPDANMCLKYTFGVNAWKQWVMTKNADIEKSSIRRRTFKTELLQMTADELNYSLCLFVKEVRKPNGTEYAPDTIYYLVLGIQQYLYENGRIDNIFTDPYYERFTDCLDEVARKFSVLYNDSQYIVTRVEEEHLWECKQLGAHSPHVLLSTLMFFNTKHFNLTTVEEHMQLSFSHIMKHWKRSAQNAKAPGTRNVLLRFYPPQAGLDANPRKKKVYEQQENEENPLRCPVRLYEFYLSKCPESVKTRNDVFYLQPERSCVPDSPVWYSTQALSQEALQKMLHRVKMVKEINIALLTS